MMNATRDLAQIQRWMQSVIMNSAGVIDGIASADAQAEIDISPAEVETVIQRSAQQTSVERLQIYAGAYYARLLECLRAEFPVMVKAMGEDLFDEFAVEYLRRYPSRSYTLDHLGANFANFLAETRPTSATEDNSWLDFLADLAKLEWNFAEVFDGRGAEQSALLEPEQLLAVSAERWAEASLIPVPCLRILRLDFPVHEYYRALREGEEAIPPARETTWLAISRRNYFVKHHTMTPPEAAILEAIIAGATVGEAIGRAAVEVDVDRFAENLRDWFGAWTANGFFLTVKL